MSDDLSKKITGNAKVSASHGESYDEYWRRVGSVDPDMGYAKVRKEFIEYVMKKYLQPEQDLRILDLGCGTGWLTAFLARYGKATGVDFAPDTITRAQEVYGSLANYVLADPDSPKLGLPNDTMFDFVVASEVIEHVEDQKSFLSQVSAFLIPNGWFLLTTPNKRYWKHYQKNERFQIWGQPIENWLTPDEGVRLLKEDNFQVIWREGWPDSGGYTALNKLADNRYCRRLSKVLGVYHFYARLILPFCMFQMILARKNFR
jgi:2-polyprenyl-3-methyl-5-hydroxy-6-metoxy-1,4-benzoquinol methylase